MSQKELLDYIRPNLEKGFKAEQLKTELLKAGWEEEAIDEAFVHLSNKEANSEDKQPARINEGEIEKTRIKEVEETNTKEKKHFALNSKLKIALIVFLGLCVLVAVAFFAYARLQDSPMKVLEKSLSAMEAVQSFSYSLEIEGQYQWKSGDFVDLMSGPLVALGVQVPVAEEAPLSPGQQHQATLILSGYNSTQVNNLDSYFDISFWSDEMRTGDKIAIETRVLQDKAYLKVSLPSIGDIDLSILEDKWLEAPLEREVSRLSDLIKRDSNSPSTDTSLSENVWEEMDKAKEVIIKHKPFAVIDNFSGSLANGQKTYHYILEFDKQALENIILELQAEDDLSQEQALKEYFANIESISGELVVDRDDYLIHQVVLSFKVKEGAYNDEALQVLSLDFNLSLRAFNQAVEIDKPESSIGVEEVLEELFESLMADMTPEEVQPEEELGESLIEIETDVALDSDADNLTDDEEINIYNSDPLNPDTDGDGLSDYEEVRVYSSDPLNPDTDGDSYLDGEEVLHGYNPSGDGLLESSY